MGSHRCAVAALGSLAVTLSTFGAAATGAANAGTPDPAPGFSIAVPAQPVGHAGRWLTDADGRVVVIHGVNVSMKGTPAQSQAYRFGADDAAFLASIGLNAVRLTVERYDIEPTPGHFDTAYLGLVRAIVRTLDRYGVMTLIDFHQDEFGPVFHDNGFPAWMTSTGGLPNVTSVGFPFQYLANPALNHAFDNLWNNGPDARGASMWTDDARILGHAVAALHATPGVLGYEVLNEPWPGTKYPTCFVVAVGCPSFDEGALSGYYATMDKAIRVHDHQHLVFFEPLVSFNYGIPTSVTPPTGDRRVGFAFHDYPVCSAADDAGLPVSLGTDCGVEDDLTLHNAVRYATQHSTGLLETEFGATTKPAPIVGAAAEYDADMVPWMFWSYQELIGLGSNGAFTTPPGSTPNRSVITSLSRPYPQLVSGTPRSWGYDPKGHVFTASYSTSRADGRGGFAANAISQFEIPKPAYPHGYDVAIAGAQVVSGNGDPILLVAADPGARTVSLTVTPAG